MTTDLNTHRSVAQILGDRLQALSRQDVESRERTAAALAGIRAMIAELEAMEFDD